MDKKAIIVIIVVGLLYWVLQTPSYVDKDTQIELKYHIEYTANASDSASLPIIIALHGNGDTYDNFYKYTLKELTVPARVILIEAPKKYWPYDASQLKQYSAAIASFTEQMQYQYGSQIKPMLLGFSGGGVMAYYSALTQCNYYSVIVPISGMLQNNMLPENITTDNQCRVEAFHGIKDNVVSFSSGMFAVNELKKHSKNIEFTSFDAGHQGIFTEFKQMILTEVGKRL